jgi:hypothetical protein
MLEFRKLRHSAFQSPPKVRARHIAATHDGFANVVRQVTETVGPRWS